MENLAESIVTGVYSGLLARSLLTKFARAIDLPEDQEAEVQEYLTELLAGYKPRTDGEVGLYARTLASHAILNGLDSVETQDTFLKVRSQFRSIEAENTLSSYVFQSASAATATLKFISMKYGEIGDLLNACRNEIDRIATVERSPVNVIMMTWGPLGDATFAHHAYETLVVKTGFATPQPAHFLSVLREDISAFRSNFAENATAYGTLFSEPSRYVSVQTALTNTDAFLETFLKGRFISTAYALDMIGKLLEAKADLEQTTAEDKLEERDDLISKISGFVLLILGGIEWQRNTLYQNSVVLATRPEDPVGVIVINADNADILDDPDKRTAFIAGMYNYLQTGLVTPETGLTKSFVEQSLPFYAERALENIAIRDQSADVNLLSRAHNAVIPLVMTLLSAWKTEFPEGNIGNLEAAAEQIFVRMTSTENNPSDYLLTVLGALSNAPYLEEVIAEITTNHFQWSLSIARVYATHLRFDFFVPKEN